MLEFFGLLPVSRRVPLPPRQRTGPAATVQSPGAAEPAAPPPGEPHEPGAPPAPEAPENARRRARRGRSGRPCPAAFARAGLAGRRRGRRSSSRPRRPCRLTAQQRLLLLDTWRRSGLPAGDFAALVGLSKHTLYAWKKKFDTQGPAGLMDQPRGGPQREQATRPDQAHHPHAQAGQPLLGLPAHQRPAGARPGLAGQRRRGGARAARGGLRTGGGHDPPPPPTRSARSSGPSPISCGRPTCLRLS